MRKKPSLSSLKKKGVESIQLQEKWGCMIFIGIDPGMSGGIAWIDGGLPHAEKFADKTPKDISDLFDRIRGNVPDAFINATLERVHSMPKQGVASSFKFGVSFGFLQGLLYAHGIPFEFVTPQKWQKSLGCLSHGDKNVTKDKAQRIFPSMKITHAVADALLLAEYGVREYGMAVRRSTPDSMQVVSRKGRPGTYAD